ncbi:MAG: hypothetical protein COB30_005610 [Ectothiorhodospiraceae bacterium]|nr:hypothetical protein [Ectothiorhodospiraceae bacterium]
MNILILIAGVLSLVAFFAHAFVGDKEYKALKPTESCPDKSRETWVQVRSGWHWVSVDLFLSGVLLLLLATTEIIKAKTEILLLLSIYFLFCGVIWLGTVVFSRTNNKQIIVLGQWIFCFLMSGLIYFGGQQNV